MGFHSSYAAIDPIIDRSLISDLCYLLSLTYIADRGNPEDIHRDIRFDHEIVRWVMQDYSTSRIDSVGSHNYKYNIVINGEWHLLALSRLRGNSFIKNDLASLPSYHAAVK